MKFNLIKLSGNYLPATLTLRIFAYRNHSAIMVSYNIHSKYNNYIKKVTRWILVIRNVSVFFDGLDRAGSGQGQVAGTCECGDKLSGFTKCGEFYRLAAEPLSFSRRTLFHAVNK